MREPQGLGVQGIDGMGAPQHFQDVVPQVYRLVKRAIDQADPIRLLAIGAPEDEYESEIREIVSHLGACTTLEEVQTLVHNVFASWFDACLAGSKEQYHPLAATIWEGVQTFPSSST